MADITNLARKYPFVPIGEIRFWIANNSNPKYIPSTLDLRLKLINECNQYNTPSKPGDPSDEPQCRNLLRSTKTLDDVLTSFPKDICRIVFDYAVVSHSEIITEILSNTADMVESARLLMTNDICRRDIVRLNILNPADNSWVCDISLHKKSAKITDQYIKSKVLFAKKDIKNQAITAAQMVISDRDIIAICVQTILIWRSYAM